MNTRNQKQRKLIPHICSDERADEWNRTQCFPFFAPVLKCSRTLSTFSKTINISRPLVRNFISPRFHLSFSLMRRIEPCVSNIPHRRFERFNLDAGMRSSSTRALFNSRLFFNLHARAKPNTYVLAREFGRKNVGKALSARYV